MRLKSEICLFQSLPPRGKALFCLFHRLPLGGKAPPRSGGDEGHSLFSKSINLSDNVTAPHQSTFIGFPSGGFSRQVAAQWQLRRITLPRSGGDEGHSLFSESINLSDNVTAPHQSTTLTASPQGKATNRLTIFSRFSPLREKTKRRSFQSCNRKSYFRKVFNNSLSSAETRYESRHFEIALFIVNLFKRGAPIRYASVLSRKCVKHSAISHAFAIFT